MRITSLDNVVRLVRERQRLMAQRDAVNADQHQVSIRGSYMDDTIAALVRPVIVGELSARIGVVEAELTGLNAVLD